MLAVVVVSLLVSAGAHCGMDQAGVIWPSTG